MKPTVYDKIRNCSKVGLHAWYNSSVGVIRKPIKKEADILTVKSMESLAKIDMQEEAYYQPSLFKRIWRWVKGVFRGTR